METRLNHIEQELIFLRKANFTHNQALQKIFKILNEIQESTKTDAEKIEKLNEHIMKPFHKVINEAINQPNVTTD